MDEKMTASLPEGWTIDEEAASELPPGWKIEEEEPEYRDIVSEQLREQGYEPDFSEELERATEYGMAETYRGILSGATFGLTENVPGLKTKNNFASTTGKVIGSFAPLSKLTQVFTGPAMKLAAKSPVFQKQLGSLATMFGVGAASKGIESVAEGEIPSAEDLLEHGAEWAALDALLQGAGFAGRFAKSLLSRSKATGIPRKDIINGINSELKSSGVDMTNPEAVSAKALEILEKETPKGEEVIRRIGVPKKSETPVEKVAQASLKSEPITPKQLKDRKIDDQEINRLSKESVILSEPYQPENVSFAKEAEALENTAIESKIESVGARAATEEDLGNAIREDINANLEAAKKSYAPLYLEAEEAAENIYHNPSNTAREAGNRLNNLERIKTRPENYSSTIRQLETILEDAGYQIQRDQSGTIELIVQNRDVHVSESIELGRRVNNLINYELIDPSVKNILKPVAAAVKQDIRIGLRADPAALEAFELAEAEHARVSELFNKQSIRRIRNSEAGEKITGMTNAPSTLGDLRTVVSPNQMQQIEREMLEKLNNQSFEKAQKQLREIERHLSADNRKLAREIVEAKNPHNPLARRKLAQDAILNDMSNAFTNGTRPEKVLNLWKTPKGQGLVRETFNNSPNWSNVKSYLEKQSFNDMVSSVLSPKGTIDTKKLKNLMKDPGTVNNLRMLGGEEAVSFFRDLDAQVNQLEKNIKLLDRFPKQSDAKLGKSLLKRTKQKNLEKPKATKIAEEKLTQQATIAKESSGEKGRGILKRMAEKDFPIQAKAVKWKEWFAETLGITPKAALSVFSLMKLGLPDTVLTLFGFKILNKLATNPRARDAFKEAAHHYTNPVPFMVAFEHLGDILDEEESSGDNPP